MKLGKYLKDRFGVISLFIFMYIVVLLMLLAFKSTLSLILGITVVLISFFLVMLIIEFCRKKIFYDNFLSNLEKLDKKYLVIETLSEPNFYEGEILYNSLYEINKSMLEDIKNYSLSINDFKEYIEMWIHEVKIPIASLLLMAHNHKDKFDSNTVNQIKRLDNYVEQVLFYVRSENLEKDYLIKEIKLERVISNVALKNKDDLLESKIELIVKDVNTSVLTDSKWLEFILNQIINNSIKYSKEKDSYIKITMVIKDNKTILSIYDNGIGIPKEDLDKVFNKSFTGYNGRIKSKSTGMGLYIAKKLCTKLGHKIEIDSKKDEFTVVMITFNNNYFYSVLK